MDEQSRSIGSYVRGAGRAVKHGAGSVVDTIYGSSAVITGSLVALGGVAGSMHPTAAGRRGANLAVAAAGATFAAAGHRLRTRNRDIRRARDEGREQGRNGL